MKKILSFIAAIVLCSSVFAQKQKIELNLTKGSLYTQKMEVVANIVQTIQGNPQTINMTIIGNMDYKVVDVQNSVFEMETTYKSLAMKMKMPTGEMEFNSEKKDEHDVLSKVLSALINKTFTIKMNKFGKVVELKNVESLFSSMFDKIPQMGEMQKQQILAQMKQAYGEKAMKSNIESSMAIFPESEVAVGDKWVVKNTMESGMSMNFESTYQLKEVTADYYAISGSSIINPADKNAVTETNGLPFQYDMSGTMVSDLKIDKKTGWVNEAKIKQELKGTATIKDSPNAPGGMSIPMEISTTMQVTGN